MKYVHYDKKTGKILGWYTKDLHSKIPKPNYLVSDKEWKDALNAGCNAVDFYDEVTSVDKITFCKKDFRTEKEIAKAKDKAALFKKKHIGKSYKEGGSNISFTKDDALGLLQVQSAFSAGILDKTVIYFSNGTKLPITKDEFEAFAKWFTLERAKFFK